MRYLKPEYSLTEDSNHMLSQEERELRKSKWEEQCKEYNSSLKEQQHHFSKKVMKYIVKGLMHDMYINDFHCYRIKTKKRDKFTIEIKFYDKYDERTILIKYDDVKFINCGVDLLDYLGFGDYLYGEIIFENKLYTHNFVIVFDSEISITCKRIIIYD